MNQDEINSYLDGLRESGITNMFGAGPYLEAVFALTPKEARACLAEWMRTFSARQKERDP